MKIRSLILKSVNAMKLCSRNSSFLTLLIFFSPQEINDPRSAWSHCSIDSLELFLFSSAGPEKKKNDKLKHGGHNWWLRLFFPSKISALRTHCGFKYTNEEKKKSIKKLSDSWGIRTSLILIGPKKGLLTLKKGICSCIWTALGIWNVEHNNDIGSYIL